MDTYIKKLRHIIPIFLIAVIACTLIPLLGRWIFTVKFPILNIKESIWEFWIPMILPAIPIIFWLRQRFRPLIYKRNKDNGKTFLIMLCWLTMTAVSAITQNYFTTTTGKIKRPASVREITATDNIRYYQLGNFNIDTTFTGVYVEVNRGGKYDQDLNFTIYFVVPVVDYTNTDLSEIPKHWYAIRYFKKINDNLSVDKKEKLYTDFFKESLNNIKNYNFHNLNHFEKTPKSDTKENFHKAIASIIRVPIDDSFIILEPRQEKYENRNGNKFIWIFGSFAIGLLILLIGLLQPGFSELERWKFQNRTNHKKDDLILALRYLIPKGEHFGTSIILDLNIMVFFAMIFFGVDMMSPDIDELMEWGANRRYETIHGEYWRLLTCIFIHGNLRHLILNMFGLILASIILEPLFGWKKYFTLYILTGICASLTSIYWHSNSASIGASGAIFGLYGAVLVLLIQDVVKSKKPSFGMLFFAIIYIGINLLWGMMGGIDNAAHIGGLISGLILGSILFKTLPVSRYS